MSAVVDTDRENYTKYGPFSSMIACAGLVGAMITLVSYGFNHCSQMIWAG